MDIVNGIYLPEGDTHFAEQISANPLFAGKGTYQFNKLVAALDVVPADRRAVAVDIGAHVGLWSRVLAHHFDQVVAFEPVEAFADCFALNVADVRNVALHKVALGHEDAPGGVGFVVEAGNSGNSRFAGHGGAGAPTTVVSMRTLDSYRLPRLDFLKIDVEGFERQVVEGAQNTIRMHKPVIVVEQKPDHAERYGYGQTAAVKLLESWGFSIAWTKAGDYCMKWDRR